MSRLGTMKSTESDVCYFEVDAVFNREPVELVEESTWTTGLRRHKKLFNDLKNNLVHRHSSVHTVCIISARIA